MSMEVLWKKADPLRNKDMADSLYQLLALPDTVPMEHTEVRNIIL